MKYLKKKGKNAKKVRVEAKGKGLRPVGQVIVHLMGHWRTLRASRRALYLSGVLWQKGDMI
jgi:hypothetical protein